MEIGIQSVSGRYLDSLETYHYEHRSVLPWMIEFQGSISPTVMQRAVRLLTIRHPVLRARIRADMHGYWLAAPNDYFPQVNFFEGERLTCLREAEALKESLHPALSYFLLVQGELGGYVVFCFSHAIVDAHASFSYLAEFWDIYTDMIYGYDTIAACPGALPNSTAEILSLRRMEITRAATQENANSHNRSNRMVNRENKPLYLRPVLIKLDPDESAAFIQSSRYFRTTVGALIVAIMAVTIRGKNLTHGAVPIAICAGVDHRKAFDAPISETECTGGFVFPRIVTIEVPANADPVQVSKDFSFNLREEVERRKDSIHGNNVQGDHLDTSENSEYSIALNNWGRIPPFRTPSGVEFTTFSLMGLVPDSKVSELVFPPHPSSLTTYTFNGCINIAWRVPDDLDERILKEFLIRCRNAKRGFTE